MKSSPNMVENHCECSDSTQSMDMKVTLSDQKITPGPARNVILPWALAGPSRSSTSDQRL